MQPKKAIKKWHFPHKIVLGTLAFITALLFGAIVVPRWIPDPILEGPCLNDLPPAGELIVFDFSACPIGYMDVDYVQQIQSFRQGWIDPRYEELVYAQDTVQRAFSGTNGVAIYPNNQYDSKPTLAVYWDKEEELFLVTTRDQDLEAYLDTSDLTACYGETDVVICIGIYQSNYWYLPYDISTYAQIWVAWLTR